MYYLEDLLLAARRNLELARMEGRVFGRYAAMYARRGLAVQEEMEQALRSRGAAETELLKMVRNYRRAFLDVLGGVEALGIRLSEEN